MKKTFIISAFPGCGKTFCFKSNNELTILDSDSSNFSWVKDEKGNNTKERHPDFPENYINHIKSNIGKVDVIFVSSHKNVREALYNAGLNITLVYPDKDNKEEWIKRFKERGNDEKFISFISDNWDEFIDDIENDYVFNRTHLHKLKKGEFISTELIPWIIMYKSSSEYNNLTGSQIPSVTIENIK